MGALGRIDVTKLEKTPNGNINIIIRRWGPDMGERYIWKYTPYKHYGGIDPFKPFDQGDGNWHNISQQAFLAAVGHAMRNQRSSLSYIAIPELRQKTRTEESGGIFRKKVKTTVDWYAKPRWIVSGPIERGGAAAFTTAFRVPGCDPAKDTRNACIANTGVSFITFDGGNMTSAQTQWLGEVGNGQLQANPSGGWADPTSAVNGSWVQPDMAGTQGGLNQHWQKYQPRASEYSETNGVLMLREGTPVQSGIMDGINSPPQQ